MTAACVFSIDENYVIPFQVFYHSLEATSSIPKDCPIFILHTTSLTSTSIEKLARFSLIYGRSFSFLDATGLIPKDLPIKYNDHVTAATFYRLFISEILPSQIKTVVYLDVDMLAIRDSSALFKTDVREMVAAVDHFRPEEGVRLWGSHGSTYFQAGVLVIPLDRWREENMPSKLTRVLQNNRDLIKWWDQDVLNIALQNSWQRLSVSLNMHGIAEQLFSTKYAKENASIIHFSGHRKPWNTFKCSEFDNDWDRVYEAVFNEPFDRNRLKPSLFRSLKRALRAKLKGLYYGID